jgi:uncharacterized protein YndB with AHSA1/START domain
MNPDGATFCAQRVLAYPPQTIYQAFARPELLARWWGPAGFTNTFEVFEFRPGGRWVFVMHGPDGSHHPNESVFVELHAPSRLVIQHVSKPHFVLTVTLAAHDVGTTITWTQVFEDSAVAARIGHIAEPANEQNLDRLQLVLHEQVGRKELLSRLRRSRDAVAALLAAIPPATFLEAGAIGAWSVRDLLAHFVAHEQRALAEIAAARRGDRLTIDATATNEFNAGAVFAWASLQPPEAWAAWDRSYRQIVETVEALADADVAPGSALEQALGDTVDGALANNTYTHYEEHMPALEAFVARCRPAAP